MKLHLTIRMSLQKLLTSLPQKLRCHHRTTQLIITLIRIRQSTYIAYNGTIIWTKTLGYLRYVLGTISTP